MANPGNIAYQLEHMNGCDVPSTTPTHVIRVKDTTYGELCLFGYCLGAPGTYATVSGVWSKGALCLDVNAGVLYINSSAAATAPSWAVTS